MAVTAAVKLVETIIREANLDHKGVFMLRLVLSIGCLMLAPIGTASAGSMPTLPELPPLPTNYVSQGHSGAYAGILSGYSRGADNGLGIGLVIGNTFSAADLLLGVEAVAFAATRGEVTLEGDIRAGFGLTDTINVFGTAGLGHSFDTDAFFSVGATLEADVGDGWLVRVDYRYNHDLSGDAGTHKVMTG
ncbi:opacity protein-like surface antigen, partial [Devosia sp. UYZn731]